MEAPLILEGAVQCEGDVGSLGTGGGHGELMCVERF